MKTAGFPSPLADAAAFERDRRAASYPGLVGDGSLDAEQALVDFQAWFVIADWLDKGHCRLLHGWGGSVDDPKTILSWQLLEDCAGKALAALDAKLANDLANPAVAGEDRQATRQRRDDVFLIHNLMVKQRESASRTAEAVALVRAEITAERAARQAA